MENTNRKLLVFVLLYSNISLKWDMDTIDGIRISIANECVRQYYELINNILYFQKFSEISLNICNCNHTPLNFIGYNTE